MRYLYSDRTEALADMKQFSGMNIHEDRPLYLHVETDGWTITSKACDTEVIALNGHVYTKTPIFPQTLSRV